MTEKAMTYGEDQSTKAQIVAMLPQLADALPMLADTLGGGTMAERMLDKVSVPGSGGTTWTVPDVEGEKTTQSFEGVLVGWGHERGYWAKSYNAANPAPPDCVSPDAVTGSGDRGEFGSGPQDCETCPLAQWGTKIRDGEPTAGQACKTMIKLFILQPGSFVPIRLRVPPTSLKAVEKYLFNLTGKGIPWWGAVTEFTRTKQTVGGYPTAVITPRLGERLEREHAEQMRAYKDTIAPLVRRAGVDTDDAIDVS